jgi:hypothetical protein
MISIRHLNLVGNIRVLLNVTTCYNQVTSTRSVI